MSLRFILCVAAALLIAAPGVAAADQPAPPAAAAPAHAAPPSAANPAAFNATAATDAYLARMTPEQRARSDAYFEGGYWLQLWNFLVAIGISWLLLATGVARRIRDFGERIAPWRWLQTFIAAAIFIIITSLLSLPLTIYQGYFREHQYNMANQTFGPWMIEQAMQLGVSVLLGGIALTILYAVLRAAPRTWWIWGSVVTVGLSAVFSLAAPVFISPLFNNYTTLEDPALKGPILSLARANEIPAENVYVSDASRQTTRVSANVSGMLGTTRITLNDNLLKRCSPASIRAVMGHEMGHYVLNHGYKGLLAQGVMFVFGFAFLAWGFGRVQAGHGAKWGIRGVGDIAGFPLLSALLATYFFILTPISNTITRTMESEADIFGLNAAREPDGFAEAALMLSEYRKMSPGPVEEYVFFDHPSGHTRILQAMTWKAENLERAQPGSGF